MQSYKKVTTCANILAKKLHKNAFLMKNRNFLAFYLHNSNNIRNFAVVFE